MIIMQTLTIGLMSLSPITFKQMGVLDPIVDRTIFHTGTIRGVAMKLLRDGELTSRYII